MVMKMIYTIKFDQKFYIIPIVMKICKKNFVYKFSLPHLSIEMHWNEFYEKKMRWLKLNKHGH